MTKSKNSDEFGDELRRGPWTLEEDNLLIQYVSCHGDGRWNSLAKYAGLQRTGKSCRLRWLNYLKPDIKRGNLSPHEQLLILELHSKWGNRWSKIAKHLPGRTDNEIKNYWRTQVQKQARQLQVDSNSSTFLEAARQFWKTRLPENMQLHNNSSISSSPSPSSSSSISTIEQSVPPKPSNNSHSNSVEKIPSIHQQLNSELLCENSAHEEKYNCSYYYVGSNYHPAASYNMQELEPAESSMFGCHAGEADWLGEELGNSFLYSDELWQFKNAEETIIGA